MAYKQRSPIIVAEGGTGATTFTLHGILVGNTTGAIQTLAEASNGQIPIGSTGNNPVLATLTAGAGINITNAAGSITIDGTGIPESQIFYVGKHGNDANAGTSIGVAVLTFGQAITLATAAVPSAVNRFAICCFDDGIYTENITVPQYVDVYAPNATLSGTIVSSNDDSTITFSRLTVATGTIGLLKNGGSAYTNVTIDYIVCSGTGIGFLCTSGYLNCTWKELYVEDGFGVGDLSSSVQHIHIKGGDIYITGTGMGVARSNAGSVVGRVDHIADIGVGAGTAIAVFNGTVNLNVSDIDCDTAYNVNGATSTLNLFANEISGTRTTAAGGTANFWVPLVEMTNGQLVIGSTGADPVVGNLASAGSTIDITTGAGTLNIETGAAVATSYLADDANSAIPAAGVLTVAGGNNISTTAAASTLTISLTDTTQYALQVGDAAGSLDSLAIGTANQVLQSGGAGANPAWSTATYPATTSQGDILYSSSDNVLASLAKDANATRYLSNTGASNNPAWAQVNLSNGVTGTLSASNGGTGVADPTDHAVLVGAGAAAITPIAVGDTGELLVGATGGDPAFANIAYGNFTFSNLTPATTASLGVTNGDGDPASGAMLQIGLSAGAGDAYINFQISATQNYALGIDNSAAGDPLNLTNSTDPSNGDELISITSAGVITLHNDLDVTEGGTGVSTLTSHGILLGNGTGDIQALAEATDGQLPIGSTGNNPVLATLTAGAGISVTNDAGSITIAATGSGMGWEEVTDATKSMSSGVAYGANRGGGVTFTLPASISAGERLEIIGIAGNWVLAQNAGQTVYIGDANTTTGAGGSLTATDAGDCIELVCIVTDTDFRVKSAMGNITVA